jgi:predicted AlkP superfamily phosphohydrolase/phosphomutase
LNGIRKVVVIGLDGLDPRITEQMLARGALPNLARLRERGGYSRLATTYPAQTPVAWSTFATGTNPGGHGIFDFLRRDPLTYRPDLALNRYEQASPFLPPKAVNLRGGVPVWEILGGAGIPSAILRCPCTYPPDKLKGRMLSGMGVPDVRGGFGTSTLFTERTEIEPRESEQVVAVERRGQDTFVARLPGPRNPKKGEDAAVELTIVAERELERAVVGTGGVSGDVAIGVGNWSDWLRIKFKLSMLQSVHGMVRFHLVGLDPFELYASPINFDPNSPMFPISTPWDFAGELERKIGPYHTTGMAEDHTGLMNERFDEAAFLQQCATVLGEREAMLDCEYDRLREGLLYCLFDTPDRIQHMFWRFREEAHPANRGRMPQPEMHSVIEGHYQECDAIVGRALARADEATLFVVLSDHGFGSFQRGVHVNRWLLDQGLLGLKPGVEPGDSADELLQGIDWERTKAYAIGLGSVYLNIEGREGEGVVKPGEARELAMEIAGRLRGLEDPDRGEIAVRDVKTREEIWHGPHAKESPDLLLLFANGYRVSWGTALGAVPEGWFEDNVGKWAGDHILDPPLVPGVLFMNRAFDGSDPRLLDLAPTVLGALGVPKGERMEGESLFA